MDFLFCYIFIDDCGIYESRSMDGCSRAPKQSDIIIPLGGGTIERTKKAVELIDEGYIKQKKLLLLGESWYNRPYIRRHYPNLDMDIDESPKNTFEEIDFIKHYMIRNGYESAIIVTDPPHSARVKLLTRMLHIKGDENLSFVIVGSGVKWWDEGKYYDNDFARNFAFQEIPRIAYRWLFLLKD